MRINFFQKRKGKNVTSFMERREYFSPIGSVEIKEEGHHYKSTKQNEWKWKKTGLLLWRLSLLNLSLLSAGSFVSRLGRLSPRRTRDLTVFSATLALSFTTTVGMVDWVHRHTSHCGPDPQPPGLTCLSQLLCPVLRVRHDPYRCPASLVYQSLLSRRQSYFTVPVKNIETADCKLTKISGVVRNNRQAVTTEAE